MTNAKPTAWSPGRDKPHIEKEECALAVASGSRESFKNIFFETNYSTKNKLTWSIGLAVQWLVLICSVHMYTRWHASHQHSEELSAYKIPAKKIHSMSGTEPIRSSVLKVSILVNNGLFLFCVFWFILFGPSSVLLNKLQGFFSSRVAKRLATERRCLEKRCFGLLLRGSGAKRGHKGPWVSVGMSLIHQENPVKTRKGWRFILLQTRFKRDTCGTQNAAIFFWGALWLGNGRFGLDWWDAFPRSCARTFHKWPHGSDPPYSKAPQTLLVENGRSLLVVAFQDTGDERGNYMVGHLTPSHIEIQKSSIFESPRDRRPPRSGHGLHFGRHDARWPGHRLERLAKTCALRASWKCGFRHVFRQNWAGFGATSGVPIYCTDERFCPGTFCWQRLNASWRQMFQLLALRLLVVTAYTSSPCFTWWTLSGQSSWIWVFVSCHTLTEIIMEVDKESLEKYFLLPVIFHFHACFREFFFVHFHPWKLGKKNAWLAPKWLGMPPSVVQFPPSMKQLGWERAGSWIQLGRAARCTSVK